MTIKPSQILNCLNTKRSQFEAFDRTTLAALEKYRTALANLSQEPDGEILQQLKPVARNDRGAEPLEPLGNFPNWIVPSKLVWQSREQSLEWVRDRLTGIATFAVDGSQIYPTKDISIPVALVQIGWYENFHLPNGHYEKDIALDVMTPADLRVSNMGDPVDRRVNMRRFEMETERLIQYMEDRAGCGECLAFFDGALVVTFAEAFEEDTRDFYVRCVVRLLHASEKYRVPLVGYIDTSYARDLTLMLQHLGGLPEVRTIHDAPLLAKGMRWGDRTPLFCCRRPGILKQYPAGDIAFSYLKAHDGYPVRLEFPAWMYEAGLAESVLDWIRCEVIIGSGYPYVIETADQTAVLRAEDRQVFYRLLQEWAENENLNLRLSRKMVSKARRR
ncbi:DNA double-strand break repair nuclease NurA [Leptolyngbya sp. FACHB-36]|uniref:DNA double-strand break repair nuclease NurA n=1 Tax=Leptolyngbya sp. FACHB-36 TaxID=2692808 RepID=UPI0016819C07|nr:DNA double-strand break repair nuclease NurA [Leptolyngbya sp. FACHB-36]MBD2022712.1 DNA double-strand break repair nuclease NurA [Leptolyngbya sp. FACHB-36]